MIRIPRELPAGYPQCNNNCMHSHPPSRFASDTPVSFPHKCETKFARMKFLSINRKMFMTYFQGLVQTTEVVHKTDANMTRAKNRGEKA